MYVLGVALGSAMPTTPSAWDAVVASGIVPQPMQTRLPPFGARAHIGQAAGSHGIAPPWIAEATARDIELDTLPDLSEAGPETDDLDFSTPIHYGGSNDVFVFNMHMNI